MRAMLIYIMLVLSFTAFGAGIPCKDHTCVYDGTHTNVFGHTDSSEKWKCFVHSDFGAPRCKCVCHASFKCELHHNDKVFEHCNPLSTNHPTTSPTPSPTLAPTSTAVLTVTFQLSDVSLQDFDTNKKVYEKAFANSVGVHVSEVSMQATTSTRRRLSDTLNIIATVLTNDLTESDEVKEAVNSGTFSSSLVRALATESINLNERQISGADIEVDVAEGIPTRNPTSVPSTYPTKPTSIELTLGSSTTLQSGQVSLAPSGNNQLLRLTKTVGDKTTLAGRSYGGFGWESAAPEFFDFSCDSSVDHGVLYATSAAAGTAPCNVIIPDDGANYRVEVMDFTNQTPDTDSQAARFLTLSSFGPTKAAVEEFKGKYQGSPKAWLEAELNKPATLHRAFFREHSNPRYPHALGRFPLGTLQPACDAGSRWHRFAFTKEDAGKSLKIAPNTLSIDAHVRTVVDDWDRLYDDHVRDYRLESVASSSVTLCNIEEKIGGWVRYLDDATGKCGTDRRRFPNPKIVLDESDGRVVLTTRHFATMENNDADVAILSESAVCDVVPLTGPVFAISESSEESTPVSEHWTVIGASNQPNQGPVAFQDTSKHEVRCCSDTAQSAPWVKNEGCSVWGESDIPGCMDSATYLEAVGHCAAHGARLCTAQELKDDCTRGSGCNFDSHMIWSSTLVTEQEKRARSRNTYMLDRRVAFQTNTLSSPTTHTPENLRGKCPNAPKTFLNAHTCRPGIETCSPISYSSAKFTLDTTIVKQYYSKGGLNVHVLTGLDLDNTPPPCQGETSRWIATDVGKACDDYLDVRSKNVISSALLGQSNINVRDINVAGCDARKGAQVLLGSTCWRHAHNDEMNVYDFSYYAIWGKPFLESLKRTDTRNPVTAFAESGKVYYQWPGASDVWEAVSKDYLNKVYLLGHLGQTVDFVELPEDVQVEEIARLVGSESKQDDTGFEVCGSPGEVTNNPALSNQFFMNMGYGGDEGQTAFRQYSDVKLNPRFQLKDTKQVVWTNVALNAHDQLRQRMAWALSQILVITEEGVNTAHRTEVHLAYYDIFVRHAFGNFGDILKEVSYSPAMAKMLSFRNSKSFRKFGFPPDENYAREVMQLFTMGLYQLHDNGTKITDSHGSPMATYDISDVETLATAWTGFERQENRFNIEADPDDIKSYNFIDPMKIRGDWRDCKPKATPTGYLGDGVGLCVDLPAKAFLQKGATYSYLGQSSTPRKHTHEIALYLEGGMYHKHVKLDPNSGLYKKLCGASSAPCKFSSDTVLTENIPCHGIECDFDTATVLTLPSAGTKQDGTHYDVHFEYIRQPCVEFGYFANAVTISPISGLKYFANRPAQVNRPTCANPLTTSAAGACCSLDWRTHRNSKGNLNRDRAIFDSKFTGEIITHATAEARCAAKGQELCDFSHVNNPDGWRTSGEVSESSITAYWRASSCERLTQVTQDGRINPVDKSPEDNQYRPGFEWTRNPVDSKDTFPVHWANKQYPKVEDGCGDGCTVHGTTCLCESIVTTDVVFTAALPSRSEILSQLDVGAFDPSIFSEGTYVEGPSSSEVTTYFLSPNRGYNADTIFMIRDGTRKAKPLYFKNIASSVKMGNSKFEFRNPVSFYNPGTIEATRDAEHETDALLSFYLNHDSTPPFIASLLIQRFVTSNPAPRYIETVAKAFKTGMYSDIGSGTRGDLAATLAAVLLDRDATSHIASNDPDQGRVREPLVKLMHIMRSLEFKPNADVPVVDIKDEFGQWPYRADSVFGFFQQDYRPSGPLQEASLLSPESVLLGDPNLIAFMNGVQSLVKYGLTLCDGGLGTTELGYHNRCDSMQEEDTTVEHGEGGLTFSPTHTSVDLVVKELDVLLTGGRADAHVKAVIKAAYEDKLDTGTAKDALKVAQQLFLASSEFHTSAPNHLTSNVRTPAAQVTKSANPKPYKAIVYLELSGGADSFNLLIPYDGCKGRDMYQQYSDVRGNVALVKSFLLPIDDSSGRQVCRRFGLHPSMRHFQRLYNDGDALYIANVGPMVKPMEKGEWEQGARVSGGSQVPKPQFAHNAQTRYLQNVDGQDLQRTDGVLGRMMDALEQQGVTGNSFSLSGMDAVVINPVTSKAYDVVDSGGVAGPSESLEGINESVEALHSYESTSPFAQMMSNKLTGSMKRTRNLKSAMANIDTTTPYRTADSKQKTLEKQLKAVARVIKTNTETFKDERNVFKVRISGFDGHENMVESLNELMKMVDDALGDFEKEMKAQGLWDSVTIVQTSEFGRTLVSNGFGTDHGWGGNYFVSGGAVKGGQIIGQYPSDLSVDGPQIVTNKGRPIPTTSWEHIWNGVGMWFGIDDDKMDTVLPLRKNFAGLFNESDIFDV